MNRVFLDLHVIQTVPPSNINRDDTGSPKTAQYGGVRRARVSSQSWKKAMRDYFLENCEEEKVGVRTKKVVDYVKNEILNITNDLSESEAREKARDILRLGIYAKNDRKKEIEKANKKLKEYETDALFFISKKQAEGIARMAMDKLPKVAEIKKVLKSNPAIDISLFGRMLTDDPSLNEDASAQVAHAISTHAIQTEFDFFTAVDDRSGDGNAGAGMLGTVEYNSSTLYRYANVAVHELLNQLKDNESTINTINLFVKAFVNSMPTGKVNSFANHTLPQLLLVNIREDRPVNLVNAFENAIKSKDGYVSESIHRLFEAEKKANKFVKSPIYSYYVISDDENIDTNNIKLLNLKELLDRIDGNLSELLSKVGD